MPVIVMCEKSDPGAFLWSGSEREREVYIRKEYEGCVVAEREANYYDDSDFYCTVWDEAEGAFREIMFATTRGWSYPCLGTSVDARPEVRARWEAHLEEGRRAARARAEEAERKAVKVGRRVKVVLGRKVPIGSEWWVVSVEPDRFKPGLRAGLRSDAGARAWINAANLVVIDGGANA